MTTRYQERHYDDVAYIFATRGMPDIVRVQLTGDFADLFATNNPDFDRTAFLLACGLESEG